MKQSHLKTLPLEAVSHNPAIQKRVMLRQGELPHLTNFSQASFEPGQTAAAHSHSDMAEVFFVEAGQGEIWIDAVCHRLEPGVCTAVEPDESHEIRNTGKVPLVLTYFGLKITPKI